MKNIFHIFFCSIFKLINWNHFSMKAHDDKPYYAKIIKLKGIRTALVENYCGTRSVNRFYWKIGKYYI